MKQVKFPQMSICIESENLNPIILTMNNAKINDIEDGKDHIEVESDASKMLVRKYC